MKRLNLLAINAEGFVFDPTTGESFTVNATGLAILNGLKAAKTPEEIAAHITEEFEVEPAMAEHDVTDFIGHLRTYKLIPAN